MKSLFDYISEASDSHYDEFMNRIENAKCDGKGVGIILQFINNDKSSDFDTEIGRYSSMIIPFNVRNTYSFMKFVGATSQAPVDSFIKALGGKYVDEYEFTSDGFPQRGQVKMGNNDHVYTVKVFRFNVKDALKLKKTQLSFIEKPSMYFGVKSSGFFGIVSIDRPCIWNVIDEFM
jgi:hypothetical protein